MRICLFFCHQNLGCEKELCMNNATCVPNYIDDTSTCKCVSPPFSGTFCEKG